MWIDHTAERGVVREGSVGFGWLGRSSCFGTRSGVGSTVSYPDVDEAVASPQTLSHDVIRARHLLQLVPKVPALTWGRDEMDTGDMWNSNSLTAWLLVSSGHSVADIHPPANGRAPGWDAGIAVATRIR